MASIIFGPDRNEEGQIRIIYTSSQDTANNRTLVTITDINFRSYQEATGQRTRTYNWTATGLIRFYHNSDVETVTYYSDSFNAHDQGWVNLGGRSVSFSFYVLHDSGGNGSFTVSLDPYGSYNDFNVFYPSGGSTNCEYSGGTNKTEYLPAIDSSAPTITLTASVNAQNAVTLNATSDVACSTWRYQVDGEYTWTAMNSSTSTAATATIANMSGAHSFVVRAVKDSNGVTGYSNTVTTDTPSVSWSANTATTDGSILLNVSNLPANTPVRVKYGSTNLETTSWTTDKESAGVLFNASSLKQWFSTAGVTTLQSITVTASIDGYASATASLTLTAGNNMKPTVGNPAVTIVQPSRIASIFPNTWIANVSNAKITAAVSAGSNATIHSVTVNYGTESAAMAYNSTTELYEVTTNKPVTGNVTFTVIATDTRGLTGRSTYSLTGVKAYSKPTITIDSANTFRCDASGDEQSGGPYVRVKATAFCDTGISGNALDAFYFYVNEDGSSTTYNLSSGVQSAACQLLSPRPDNAITVVVVAQDKISGSVTVMTTLSGAHKDVVIARFGENTVVGIGQAPTRLSNGVGAYCDGISIPNKGGYYVGGKDTINFRGAARRGTAPETVWGYDLLRVDTSDEKSAANETKGFSILQASLSRWQNLPSSIVTENQAFSGIREVVISMYDVVVTIIETGPVVGRIWVNRAEMRSSLVWSGWKGHTPDIT